MRKHPLHIVLILMLLPFVSVAQRINFKPFLQGDNVILTVVSNPLGLNFNLKQPLIVAGDPNPVGVLLGDNATVVIELDAPLDFDLTVEFSWTNTLSLNGLGSGVLIPFTLRYAYNNTGEMTDLERRANAVEVPPAFHTVTLPVLRRRAGGPPLPPPTPEHDGYVRPRGKVYFYIYGTLDPVPQNASAGNYLGEINVNVSYADNVN